VVIIEKYNQFEDFVEEYRSSDWVFLHFIGSKNKHPLNDYPLILYVRTSKDNEYVLSFNHDEAAELTLDCLLHLDTDVPKYVADIKAVCHFANFSNVIDLQQAEFQKQGNLVDNHIFLTTSHRYFHSKGMNNFVIPLMKHLEYCQDLFTNYKENIGDEYNEFYSDANKVFADVERVGLRVNPLRVPVGQSDNVSKDHLMFTNYNVLTPTGRPSNTYDGLNFAAMNKSDGSRKLITSRYDELIEFDFDAYHVRLIGKIIGYDFGAESVHEHFSKLYNVSYEESKTMTFKYLYGGVPDDIAKTHEFFGKVKKYYTNLWSRFKRDKVLVTDIYKRRITLDAKDFYPSKLFNYMIQSLETERNILVLKSLLKKTKDFKSTLVLYHYDSFLFDYNKNDGDKFVEIVQKELQQDGFPVKMKRGKNYDELI